MIRLVLSFLAVVGLCGPVAAFSGTGIKDCSLSSIKQLPDHIVPVNYNLQLRPEIEALVMRGELELDIDVKNRKDLTAQDLQHIYMNVDESVWIQSLDIDALEESNDILSVCRDAGNQLIDIQLEKELAPGAPIKLYFKFEAKVREDGRGVYVSETEGSKYIGTRFEDGDVRLAFPGFDEPQMKATVLMTLTVSSGLTAFASVENTGRESKVFNEDEEDQYEMLIFRFKRSPSMPLSKLSFLVGQLDTVQKVFKEARRPLLTKLKKWVAQ